MKTKFQNRGILVNALNYEEVKFDVGTNSFFTQFNGKGGFNYFHYVNNAKLNIKATSYLNIFINNKELDVLGKKEIFNCGKFQTIKFYLNDGFILIKQFVFSDYIFNRFEVNFKKNKNIDFMFDFSGFVDVLNFYSTSTFKYLKENYSYRVNLKGETSKFDVVISFTKIVKDAVKNIDLIEKLLLKEIDNISIPKLCNSEMKKSLYISSMFAALENYKTIGDFRGFTAGVNYLVPFRTYYRDSYWTILCLYENNIGLIKEQILTLAKGIKDDGECPSAVKSDYTGFWSGHYDSPCFFVMMVFDYINHSGDFNFLEIKLSNGKTILNICKKVMDRLLKMCDKSNHLLYKKGYFNRLDWADAVNRPGFVTYDECLFYRALYCLGNLIKGPNVYLKESQIVKESINKILWNAKKGYYINYIDGDNYEDNLSVDTILTVLFDIVPEEKKEKLIDKFEEILYSKNHKGFVDFGLMCVYPLYKNPEAILSLSSQPFRYHNGANWPYWSGLFAYMLNLNGRNSDYVLTKPYTFNVAQNNFTPVEYFSPYYQTGSMLQAWSSTCAFALQHCKKNFFMITFKHMED